MSFIFSYCCAQMLNGVCLLDHIDGRGNCRYSSRCARAARLKGDTAFGIVLDLLLACCAFLHLLLLHFVGTPHRYVGGVCPVAPLAGDGYDHRSGPD